MSMSSSWRLEKGEGKGRENSFCINFAKLAHSVTKEKPDKKKVAWFARTGWICGIFKMSVAAFIFLLLHFPLLLLFLPLLFPPTFFFFFFFLLFLFLQKLLAYAVAQKSIIMCREGGRCNNRMKRSSNKCPALLRWCAFVSDAQKWQLRHLLPFLKYALRRILK